MTIYYVRKTGNDSNNGLSPAGAWLTIGKALGAFGISSGDTVYIGAGVYREKVTCNLTSPIAETFIIGDIDGGQTGDAGEIRLTNYTDDKAAPADQGLVDFNGKDHLTFTNISFVGAMPGQNTWVIFDATTTPVVTYIKFINCFFSLHDMGGSNNGFYITGAADVPLHWLFDRCIFFATSIAVIIVIADTFSHTADFDLDFVVQNCFAIGPRFIGLDGGNGAFHASGIIVKNCTIINTGATFSVDGAASIPCIVSNCILFSLSSDKIFTSDFGGGDLVEDYNFVGTPLAYNNVTPGAHTVTANGIAPLMHFGQEVQQGLLPRPLTMPTVGSGLLGFGDNGNAPNIDIFNRPRPAGGQSTLKAVGAFERHDTAIKESSVTDSGDGIKIIGPGDHDFYIPVDATATTISIKARYDTSHGTDNKPQVVLLDASEIGVSSETKTMAAAVNTWETLTFGAITPTTKGVVIIRCISRSAGDNGIAYFDTVNVA